MPKSGSPAAILSQVKGAIRNPYAWPGGYPRYIVMRDGEAMSCQAARDNWRSIVRATLRLYYDGWAAAGTDINWEDPALFCCHTNERIPSAYAEPEQNAEAS